jgi:dTDP-glucose 4,6-dehydratase
VDTRIVRIFNTYGPRMRMDDGRVVPNFICQALRGEPLTVYDTGDRTRSFCYVDDMAEGFVRLLDSSETTPVNMGNPGTEMSMVDLAHLIAQLANSQSEIVFVTPQDERTKDDPKTRQPDISKAKRVLGWEPQVPLQVGLRHTIEYFRGRAQRAAWRVERGATDDI